MKMLFLGVLSSVLAACATEQGLPVGTTLKQSQVSLKAESLDLRALTSDVPFTVVTFFSAHCPCQRAHDGRLRQLFQDFAPRGIRFVAIDAEVGSSPERAAREARERGYPYPIVSDPSGASIDELKADYATYTLVIDRTGTVRYSGGIDTDKTHLSDDAVPYVRLALEDLLAHRTPRIPYGKTLGCVLERS
jgi:hypothetical protein